MKLSKNCDCNLSVISMLFIIVVLLSIFYEIPTIEYASNTDGQINVFQIHNLRK